jgi:hypothetical protein
MRFYLNGVLLGEHGFTGSFADHGPGAVAYLGRSTWQANHLFHGAIDEVRLWSQARSPEEIRAGMARPADPREPGLVGLWGFDAGDARDASPRAHHGELRGAARVEAAAFPGDASPQLPAVVRGTVSDEAGEPVINTGVRLTAAAGRWIDTSSGEFGMFSVAVLDTGRFTVNVLEGNVRIASRQVVLVPGEIVDLDLRPSPPSLVARWSFEGDVRDHVGGHDGQRLGEIVTVPGVVGAALAFADSQDIVRVPVAPSLNPEGSFSIIAWIHPTARPDTPMGIVGLWGDTDPWESQRAYRLALEPGSRLWFAVSDDSHQGDASFHNFLTRPNSLPAHAWTMVTAVWDGAAGERSVYVNGVLARRRANAAGPISRSEADLSIGGLRPSPIRAFLPFSGHMDEVSFYDVALAEEEIGRLYSAHARALWSAEGNAKDVSRSGHDGVLIGGVGFTDGVRGQAFDLTEAGGYVEFDPRIGNYGTADFSLELWLRRETTPAQPSAILVKGAAALHDDAEAAVAAAAGDEYRAPRDALVLSLMAEGSLSVLIAGRREAVRMHGTIALSEGAWHHVALVREGSSARLFVDGELDTSAETARPIELRTPEPLLLGGLPRGASFPGQIDEIALHGAPLSSTAISTTHGRVLAEWRWRTWRSRLQTWGSMALGLLVVVTGSRYVAQRRERRRELLRLTEAERARQAADEANEAKSAFLANMSHEIRTPMNAIMGHAQMLRDDQALGDEQRRRSADRGISCWTWSTTSSICRRRRRVECSCRRWTSIWASSSTAFGYCSRCAAVRRDCACASSSKARLPWFAATRRSCGRHSATCWATP